MGSSLTSVQSDRANQLAGGISQELITNIPVG